MRGGLDLDHQLRRITGSDDYGTTLEKILGNVMHVDTDMFIESITKFTRGSDNILILLSRIAAGETDKSQLRTIKKLHSEFKTAYRSIPFKEYMIVTPATKTKPEKSNINEKLEPRELYKTNWFTILKNIERISYHFLREIYGTATPSTEQFNEKLRSEPTIINTKVIFGCRILTIESFKSLIMLHDNSNAMIEIIMNPMYDVRKKISKNKTVISKIFKSLGSPSPSKPTRPPVRGKVKSRPPLTSKPVKSSSGINTMEDVCDILTKFMIARYRVAITGDCSHYVKTIQNTIQDVSAEGNSASKIDGSRFIEIMDQIDIESLESGSAAHAFALNAKTIMEKIAANGDRAITEDIIKDITEVFADIHIDEELSELSEEAAIF